MSHVHDAFDYIAIALAFTSTVGVFAIGQLVSSFRNLRSHMDSIRDTLLDRIEQLERWRAAETGKP